MLIIGHKQYKMDIPMFVTAIVLVSATVVFGTEEEFVCKKKEPSPPARECDWNEERLNALESELRELRTIVDLEEGPQVRWNKSRPLDCQDLFAKGEKKDGVYRIFPDQHCPIDVYCDMTNGGWTVIQRRLDGSVNFHKRWDAYVVGFGAIDGEYWLGLDKIHRLTKGGVQVRIEFQDYDGKWWHAHYRSFTVYDVTTRYMMRVDPLNYEGNLYELLSYHDKMMFSTYDRDNDAHSSNCAASCTGGMWYRACWHLNPNGVYNKKGAAGIAYYKSGPGTINMKNSVLKIKRRETLC